jgi:hypothetical protein
MSNSIQETWKYLDETMSSLAPDREWISFAARSDHLLDPDTPLRNPETVKYPLKDDPSVIPVHTGHLERKKRFTRAYRESYFVLTPAGFLHEYSSSDPASHGGSAPMFSLFLPACTLGPPSSASAKSNKFHLEGRKDGNGLFKGGSFGFLGRGQHEWTFRAKSREDMMEWWNDIRMLCARYLVASDEMERTGPIAAAVRAAGYVSESEEGSEGEEEGSSVEDNEDDVERMYVSPEGGEEAEAGPPSYGKGSGIALDSHGYAVRDFLCRGDERNAYFGTRLRKRLKAKMVQTLEGNQASANKKRHLKVDLHTSAIVEIISRHEAIN